MSWREKLGCADPVTGDGSDRSPASATSVTSVTTSRFLPAAVEDLTPSEDGRGGGTDVRGGIPFPDRKATSLNRVVADQGFAGGPWGITTDSVVDQPRKENPGPNSEVQPELPDRDRSVTDAQRKISSLLATAYRRRKELQRLEMKPAATPGDDSLAYSPATSVHGVVQ